MAALAAIALTHPLERSDSNSQRPKSVRGYFEDVSTQGLPQPAFPRVSEYERLRNAHFYKSSIEKVGLCLGGPHGAAGPVAVTKSRAIESDNAILLRSQIN